MSVSFRSLPRRLWLLVALLLPCWSPVPLPAQDRLTPAQEARLAKWLPRTLAKLKQRESLNVAVAGDSVSAFYQPEGFARYSSSMAWHGRMLSRLGAYFSYHGGVVDVEPHKDQVARWKRAREEFRKYEEALAAWEKTKKGPRPKEPLPLAVDATGSQPPYLSVDDLARIRLPLDEQPPETSVIRVRNAARDGATAQQALEALGAEIFPPVTVPGTEVDLVIIGYGAFDALAGNPLSAYREALERAVKICKSRGADVVLAAPSLIFEEENPRESLALTRPYAQVAREVAAKTGVFCADLGAVMAREVSNLQTLNADEAFAAALDPLKRQFRYHSGIRETVNPNAAAAAQMGEGVAAALVNGEEKERITVAGGVEAGPDGAAELTLRIFNASDEERPVAVSPLAFGGFRVDPGAPDTCFVLKPGKAKRVKFSGTFTAGGRLPVDASGALRGAVLVTDDLTQEIRDVPLTARPLAVSWPSERIDHATGDVLVTAVLRNTSGAALNGVATLDWNGETREFPVKLNAGEAQNLPLRLKLPDAAAKEVFFKRPVGLTVKLPDRSLTFSRMVEGVRTLGLEERVPLAPVVENAAPPAEGGAWAQAVADAVGVYLVIEAPVSLSSERLPGQPWAWLDVQYDGRPADDNGGPGFVDRLGVAIPWEDGRLEVKKPRPAVFGDGYFLDYDPRSGFAANVTTRPDGRRRVEFSVARVHLRRHEWSLDGSGQNTLGFNARLTFPRRPGAGPEEIRDCAVVSGALPASDPRSLAVLELSRTPAARWSVRIF